MGWNKNMSLGLAPNQGGGLFEISYIPLALNLSDTLTRRPEAYHRHLKEVPKHDPTGESGIASIHDMSFDSHESLEQSLIFDPYPKISLLDHFLGHDISLNSYASNQFNDLGDFVQGTFTIDSIESTPDALLVALSRNGYVDTIPMIIKKTITLQTDGTLTIDYQFQGQDTGDIQTFYGCEFNLTVFSDQDEKVYYFFPEIGRRRAIADIGSEESVTQFDLVNMTDGLITRFRFSKILNIWFYPIITVSQSEHGFERTYQGSSLLFGYPMTLAASQINHLQIQLKCIEP
jgi:alpha-amylase